MSARRKLYLITSDLESIIGKWCKNYKPHALTCPPEEFFSTLRSNLCECVRLNAAAQPVSDANNESIEIEFDYIPDHEFGHLVKKDDDRDQFWIALDDVYVENADFSIELTRIYDEDYERLGLGIRPEGSDQYGRWLPTIIGHCAEEYQGKGSPETVILADDGTFTGGSIKNILRLLADYGVQVTQVRLGVSTFEGLRTIEAAFYELQESGLHTRTHQYRLARVVERASALRDWVNERDFFIGVPRSGYTYGSATNAGCEAKHPAVGRPYIEYWGDMEDGANIKKGKRRLSSILTDYSIRLWQEIERCSGLEGKLCVRDLPRFPGPGLKVDAALERPLIEYLEEVEKSLFDKEELWNKRKKGEWV